MCELIVNSNIKHCAKESYTFQLELFLLFLVLQFSDQVRSFQVSCVQLLSFVLRTPQHVVD